MSSFDLVGHDIPDTVPFPGQNIDDFFFDEMLLTHKQSVLSAVTKLSRPDNQENLNLWLEKYGFTDGILKNNADLAEEHGITESQMKSKVWQASVNLSNAARKGKFDEVLKDDSEILTFFTNDLYKNLNVHRKIEEIEAEQETLDKTVNTNHI